jgi:hypothetical protein
MDSYHEFLRSAGFVRTIRTGGVVEALTLSWHVRDKTSFYVVVKSRRIITDTP